MKDTTKNTKIRDGWHIVNGWNVYVEDGYVVRGVSNDGTRPLYLYEVVYIMDPALGEEAIAAMIEKFKALVETQGTVAAIDDWGKRRLAYPINDLNGGHYVLMTFTSAPELPAELDRVLKITEGVIRSMIICKDE